MTTYIVYGASDDLVEIEGTDGTREELNALTPHPTRFELRTESFEEGLAVLAWYDFGGCWAVAPLPIDEDTRIPGAWTYTLARGGRTPGTVGPTPPVYSMVLTIDTGDIPATLVLPEDADR
jgi:hypothetical protein